MFSINEQMAFRTEYQVLKLIVMKNICDSGFLVGALTEREKVMVNWQNLTETVSSYFI